MLKVIQHSVQFKTTPDALYDTYLNAAKHAAVTGGKVTISRKVGGRFSAFGGMIGGRNLTLVPNRMIVQAWRAKHWKAHDPDSILILTFKKAPGGGAIDLVHVNVPQHDFRGVKNGWTSYYWKPWRAYLKSKTKKK